MKGEAHFEKHPRFEGAETYLERFSYLANTNAAYKELQAASVSKKPDFEFWLGD